MGEMREKLVDVSEAFSTRFEEKKLPVLQVTKFDMIGETEETTQVWVLNIFKKEHFRKEDDNLPHIFPLFSYIFTFYRGNESCKTVQIGGITLLVYFDSIDYGKGFLMRNLMF